VKVNWFAVFKASFGSRGDRRKTTGIAKRRKGNQVEFQRNHSFPLAPCSDDAGAGAGAGVPLAPHRGGRGRRRGPAPHRGGRGRFFYKGDATVASVFVKTRAGSRCFRSRVVVSDEILWIRFLRFTYAFPNKR